MKRKAKKEVYTVKKWLLILISILAILNTCNICWLFIKLYRVLFIIRELICILNRGISV